MNIHDDHLISIIPTGKLYKSHVARLYCYTCKKPINWASQDKLNYWTDMGYIQMLYCDFIEDFERNAIQIPKPHYMYIPHGEKVVWLNVPFQEKDYAKSHGARWHTEEKLWYTHTGNINLDKLLVYINKEYIEELYEFFSNLGNDRPYQEQTNEKVQNWLYDQRHTQQ